MRFSLKAILVVVTVVGLWLSSMTIAGGYDLRRLLILLIVMASVSATYSSTGRRRAFWLSFALVMLVMGLNVFYQTPAWPVPNFNWAIPVSERDGFSRYYFVGQTVRAGGTLIVATIAGFIGDYIYYATRES
jgi:hypothetical protein